MEFMGIELLFTVEEANDLLPQLRPYAEDLVRASDEIVTATENEDWTALGDARERLAVAADEIASHGVVIKDIRSGLLDFAADHNGQAVYLCWRVGEPCVGFWHARDTGFAGRQPL